VTVVSDAELLQSAREGNQTALTELYIRHRGAARRVAATCRRGGDPDDLVNDAFEKVFAAIRRQKGPTDAFRAYLFVTIRRLAARYASRNHDDPYDEVPEPVVAAASATAMDPAERQIVTAAFCSLPERWQAVLWHTAVEGRHPRDVAGALGMKANAVSALAYRARERLRQAYLQAHLQAAPHPECEPHRSTLGAYVRDGLGKREHAATARHLHNCESCRSLVHELSHVNQLLARSVMPMFVATSLGEAVLETVGSTAAGLATTTGAGASGLADLTEVVAAPTGRVAGLFHGSIGAAQIAGGVAASFVLLVALGTTGSMLLDEDESSPSTETTARADGSAAPPSDAESPTDGDDGDGDREQPRVPQTLDLANSAPCLAENTDASGNATPSTTAPEDDGTDATEEEGLLGLKLALMLPLNVDPALALEDPEIQEVVCDSSSGENELVVTIGDRPAEPEEPEAEEPDRVVDVETDDISVEPLPDVVPEVEAGVDAYVDEQLGIGAAVTTNLDELCELDEDRGDLVCTLDSALGGVVTGTLSETGTGLQLEGPGGQVITLELLTNGDVVADTKLLNLLP
jgi:RNA polymerase sigma factor (sigma-70 family)